MMSSKALFQNCRSEEFVWQNGKPLDTAPVGCIKNRHNEFFSANEIKDKLRSPYCQDGNLIEQIKRMAELTVCLQLELDKDNSRFGSGFIQKVRTERGCLCPDETCIHRNRCHQWDVLTVTTVFHVVNTPHEALRVRAEVECNLNRADHEVLLGYKLLETDKETDFDWCAVEFYTHNINLIQELQTKIDDHERRQEETYQTYKDSEEQLVIMVGHPHGGPKKISSGLSLGRKTLKDIRHSQDWCQYRHNTPSCPGNSGSPVLILGQPLCGYGYWFGHPHNHSGWDSKENVTVTSIGVDNV